MVTHATLYQAPIEIDLLKRPHWGETKPATEGKFRRMVELKPNKDFEKQLVKEKVK